MARAQVAGIAEHWDEACREARISQTDRRLLASRQFLNPFSVEGAGIEKPRLE